jgi:copper homeostasis protein
MNKKLIKEACVETIAEINNAIEHQADQLELCSRLNVGGFTPSDALISYALSRNSKTIIMIRNRDDFKTS